MKKVGERLNVMKASLAKLELFSALAVAGSRQGLASSELLNLAASYHWMGKNLSFF